MKRKIFLCILTAICAACCAVALASCGLLIYDRNRDPHTEPIEEEQERLYIELSSTDHYYAVVCGLGSITSTDIEIPATYNFGGVFGELPVEAIMHDAFKDMAITSVTMPATVTSIGDNAFSGCKALTSVSMLGRVAYVGNNAFSDCTSLTTVTMADGATHIELGEYVFKNCTSLSSVTLSDFVTSFKNGLFKNCSSLKSLTIPNNLIYIHNLSFEGTAITYFDTEGCAGFSWENDLLINKTMAGYVAEYANPEATEIIVPDGVQGFYCSFKGNGNIKKVDLNGVQEIGQYSFSYSSLEELLNYQNVTNADLSAFEGTPWLEKMVMRAENLIIGKVFMLYLGEDTVFVVPDAIDTIGSRAFEGTDVQAITLPETISSIYNKAFSGCKSLESVTFKGGPPYLGSDDIFPENAVIYVPSRWLAYYNSNIIWSNTVTNQILPNPAEGFTFTLSDDQSYYTVSYRSAAGNAIIPDTYDGLPVKAIGNRAFYGVDLTGITIPDSIVSIGDNAFSFCRNIESITIPASVTSIGNDVFENCTGLASANISYGITAIANGMFKNCASLESVTIPESVTSIGDFAFRGCTNLANIVIPNSVCSIGNYAFLNCGNLKNIIIPDCVINIGCYAFYGCSNLESVIFENTEGWWILSSPNETSGTDILESDLINTQTAAKFLTDTYRSYYWKRS